MSTYVLLPSSGRGQPAMAAVLKVRVVKQSSASTAEAWLRLGLGLGLGLWVGFGVGG